MADPTANVQISATWRVVSPEYLDALRLRLTAGRLLSADDEASSPGAIVVNRAFEREYLGGGAAAVGRRLRLGLSEDQADWEVVGVVEDVRQGDVTEEPRPEFFVSYRQAPDAIAFDPMLLVRMDGERAMDAATLKGLVREMDGALVLDSIMTMDDRVMTSLVRPRAYALVLAALASLALAVAGVGLFGVCPTPRRSARRKSASESRWARVRVTWPSWCCDRQRR